MKQLLAAMLVIASLSLTACGFEVVSTGNRGVKTSVGKIVGEPLEEGMHFYNPFTTDIREVAIIQQKYEGATTIRTKDNQNVDLKFSVVYSPTVSKLIPMLQEFGPGYAETIISPKIVASHLKDAVGKLDADDFNANRETVRNAALSTLSKEILPKGLKIHELYLDDVDFNNAYENAVTQKVVAEQQALTAKNETEKIRAQAEQKILTAKAEAESMRIKSQALAQNKGLVQFEIAQKWDGKLPQYMLGNSVPLLDLKQFEK